MPDKQRVIIINDDRKIAQAVTVRLRVAGYDVQNAYDGEAGLVAVFEQDPHAIVLDIRMPKLDGLALLAKLGEQEKTRQIPVIVLSASAVDERSALDAGAFCFLAQPYDPKALLDSLKLALKHRLSTSTKPD